MRTQSIQIFLYSYRHIGYEGSKKNGDHPIWFTPIYIELIILISFCCT